MRSAMEYLTALGTAPVGATATLDELRARLCKPLSEDGIAPEQVVRDLVEDTRGGHLGAGGGRFFAWAMGGAVPAALAADWLTSAWDQNAALYAGAPAAAIAEEAVGGWLKDLLRLPAGCSFGLVSGCQMAHATCLGAARHQLLLNRGWDVERDGMSGSPQIRILASNRHGSVERAVRLLGFGDANVQDLALDEEETLRPEVLEAALQAAGGAPVIVILQAGDLNTGSFDPYRELIPIARRYAAWVHVDGAFGLWAAVSPVYEHLLQGVEDADSWSTDGHKWLNIPYDCGYAFVAHPEAHRAALAHTAPYLVAGGDARDEMEWNPEWSRRARGFTTYAALRQLGRRGIASLVEQCCEHARRLVEGLGQLPGMEILWRPVINQGLVRFQDDRQTDDLVRRINAHGGAFFMATTWRGKRAMRVSVMSWQTNSRDVEAAIRAVAECLL